MRFVRSFLFWSSIAFLLLFVWTVSFGQWSNLEFRDQELRSDFYNILFDGTPLAVLATLSGTIKKQHTRLRNRLTIFATACAFIVAVWFLLSQMFTLGFSSWTTSEIMYRDRQDSTKQVLRQRFDAGALGYGRERIVVLQPRLFLFSEVHTWDSTQPERAAWQPVFRPLQQLP